VAFCWPMPAGRWLSLCSIRPLPWYRL